MFLNSTLPSYAVVIIIVGVAAQYAYALFCLLKLAYLDIIKKEYVLWNLLILLVFFIGPTVFLVYYYKKGKDKKIPPYVESPQENPENAEQAEQAAEALTERIIEPTEETTAEQTENTEESQEQAEENKDND